MTFFRNKSKYGYKVCYREFGKHKVKIHIICNTYDFAKWHIRWYDNHELYDRKNNLIRNPTWYIIPIKTFIEYRYLWRSCPF